MDFDHAIRLDPKSSIALNNRGLVFQFKGDYEKALAIYNEAVRIDANCTSAWLNRLYTLYLAKAGDPERDVRDVISRVGWRSPIAVRAAMLGYFSALRQKRDRDAAAFLNAAAFRANRNEWPYPVIACLQGKLGEGELLVQSRDPDEMSEARCCLGLSAMYKGETEAAIEHFRWVRQNGSALHSETSIALFELERLERKVANEQEAMDGTTK